MNNIEDYRKQSFDALFRMASFETAWKSWAPALKAASDMGSEPHEVLTLGSQLSAVFMSTAAPGREQSIVSAAGSCWEALVCWYLNVVLSGTNALAVKQKKSLVPAAVNDALTVNYGNFQANTESDLLVLEFPADFEFAGLGKLAGPAFSKVVRSRIGEFGVHVVQCKTSWNDNAQIPMLWDMVYKSSGFKQNGLSIGRNGVSISKFGKFSYAFATVPTQKEKKHPSPTSVPVKRVQHLSGGNYWGKPTRSGVAFGLQEYFERNVPSQFAGSIEASIGEARKLGVGWFGYSLPA